MSEPKLLPAAQFELAGNSYVVLSEALFQELCTRAGVSPAPPSEASWDEKVAERLTARRRAAGLTQAELARRAGVRVETLNRIERGKTSPDFRTVRKLLEALQPIERGDVVPGSRCRDQEARDAQSGN